MICSLQACLNWNFDVWTLSFQVLADKGKILKEVNLKSSNLRHLKAIVSQIESLDNVISVLKVFKDKSRNVLYVDIVCDSGYTWCKAIARNAQSLHLIWKGEGQYGEKNINNQIEEYINFAQHNTHNYKTPKIVFYFACGVTKDLSDYLISREIEVKGDIVELDENTKLKLSCMANDYTSSEEEDDNDDEEKPLSSKQLQNDLNEHFDDDYDEDDTDDAQLSLDAYKQDNLNEITKINLDVTTLIALVSELTNGGENFPFKQQFLQRQAEWERTKNLNPQLEEFMKGKQLFACETAYNDFNKIVNTVGGQLERERAKNLIQRIQIVPDNPTDRAMALKESSKIKPRAKIIFGTGDRLEAVTMTSNTGFVRSAEQQDCKFPCFLHQSRALTEKKQLQLKDKKN